MVNKDTKTLTLGGLFDLDPEVDLFLGRRLPLPVLDMVPLSLTVSKLMLFLNLSLLLLRRGVLCCSALLLSLRLLSIVMKLYAIAVDILVVIIHSL